MVPVLAFISLLWWPVAVLFSYFDTALGRFSKYLDVWMDENFVDYCPSSSIIATLSLTGQLNLEHFKKLFSDNVIHARLPTLTPKPRYPELRQFLTSFLGFRIWKNNLDFSIDDHICEKHLNLDAPDLSLLHQELMNRPYPKMQSPWSIILVHTSSSTTICVRIHHVLTDGKSMLKLLTECLAGKPLKSAQPSLNPPSFMQNLQFCLSFPLNYAINMMQLFYKLCLSHDHPWTNNKFQSDKYSGSFVTFSQALSLPLIKHVAKKQGVTTSSVIMALITGAIRKCNGLSSRSVQVSYPLPKRHHPYQLTNCFYIAILSLPTHLSSALARLKSCNEEFSHAKATQIGKFTRVVAFACGSMVYPFAKKLAVNHFLPVLLTNMAGDQDGFAVGEKECTQFNMSVGTMEGTACATFCTLSYKNTITVGITSKASVISKKEIDQMGSNVAAELDRLMAI